MHGSLPLHILSLDMYVYGLIELAMFEAGSFSLLECSRIWGSDINLDISLVQSDSILKQPSLPTPSPQRTTPMSSQEGLVLLTGVTGLVGSCVLRELFDQGFKVRLAVRAESKIAAIKDALRSRYAADELDFAVVPDMAVEGAFDDALQGDVEYIIHVAAPMSKESDDLEAAIVKPSIMNTMAILRATTKQPQTKKVVITSSVGVVYPEPSALMKPFDTYNIESDPQGPWTVPFLA